MTGVRDPSACGSSHIYYSYCSLTLPPDYHIGVLVGKVLNWIRGRSISVGLVHILRTRLANLLLFDKSSLQGTGVAFYGTTTMLAEQHLNKHPLSAQTVPLGALS